MHSKLKGIVSIIFAGVILFLSYVPTGFASEYPRAVFENERTNEVFLEVQKTVTIPNGVTLSSVDANREFEFTLLSGSTPVAGAAYELYKLVDGVLVADDSGSGNRHTTSGSGVFALKADMVARFTDLRTGSSYTVKETGDKGHFVQSYPAGDGEHSLILGNKSERVGFINTYVQPEPGKLKVKKTVSIPEGYTFDANDSFSFEIKINGELYKNQTYEIQDSTGNRLGNDVTDDNGKFSIKADQTAYFVFDEAVDYDIREILSTANISRGWRVVGNDRYQGTTSEKSDVEFVNTNASFIVTKTLTEGSSDMNFVFTVTNQSGLPMAGQKYYLYDINGMPKDDLTGMPRITDESGQFTLKAGEAAYFVGINPGTKLTVAEEVSETYEIKFPNDGSYTNWTVPARAIVLPFENKLVDFSGVIQVMKTIKDYLPNEAAPSDKTFKFTLEKRVTVIGGGGAEEQVWQPVARTAYRIGSSHYLTDANGKFSLKKNETAIFDALAVGEYYRVIEDDITGLAAYKDVHLDKTNYAKGTVTEGALTEGKVLNFNYVNLYKPKMIDLVFTKVDSSTSAPLKGALFTLYADEEMTSPINVSLPSDDNGEVRIDNLHTGTYYLAEQSAPFGYYLMPKPIKIVITKTVTVSGGVESFEMNARIYDGSGNEISKTHIVNDEKDSDGVYILNDVVKFNVPNKSGTEIPAAGGHVIWFYITGGMMVLAAAALMMRACLHKEKEKKGNK